MDKLKMQTPNLADKNIEQISKLFPHVVSERKDKEGKLKKVVDFDLLRQTLSDNLVEDENERYRLDWPGKKASLLKANTPITKTLRPCKEESVNFDTTENLYIEGDNFEVLKILQESYLGKIKMIYIDPPYNTGKDFIYRDNFKVSKEKYEEELGAENEAGEKLFKNTDSNGRFHSDWLSMMYERLIVARDLLKDDGVIFISINDYEQSNLRKICAEIFGEVNSLTESPTTLIWQGSGTTAGHFANAHEYILCYAKNKTALPFFSLSDYGDDSIIAHGALKKISKANPSSEIEFPEGVEFEGESATFNGKIGGSEKQFIKNKMEFRNGKLVKPTKIIAGWAMRNQILSWLNGNETYDTKGQKIIRFYFNKEGILWYEKERGTVHPKTILDKIIVGTTKTGSKELENLMSVKTVDFPKPVSLLKFLFSFSTSHNDIILDFFSGSATTAHAVMQLNADTSAGSVSKQSGSAQVGKRKFIMVQLLEKTNEKSEAYKAGYKTIADIGKERIRRAGKKILEELTTENTGENGKEGNSLFDGDNSVNSVSSVVKNLDIGFRVYKTDSTNMKDIFYHPTELKQEQLDILQSNIKEDRRPEDLLTQVMLDLGLTLDLPIETKYFGKINNQDKGNTVFIVQTNALVACFDDNINFEKTATDRSRSIVDEIADIKPFKVVFKDASFKDDKDRINVEERFKRLSPETVVTVI